MTRRSPAPGSRNSDCMGTVRKARRMAASNGTQKLCTTQVEELKFPIHDLMEQIRNSATDADPTALRDTRTRVVIALSEAPVSTDAMTTFNEIMAAERKAAEGQLTGNARKRTLTALKTIEGLVARKVQEATTVAA